jgi:hypothetical protein
MTDDDLAALLKLGHETPGIECKGPGRRDDAHLFAQVTRAALGMSNHRDGGAIIIGVDDAGRSLAVQGLSPEQLETWTHDWVADGLRPSADPGIDFTLEVRAYEGKALVVLRIHQFDKTPVICTRNYPDRQTRGHILREATLYVRDATKAATVPVSTHAQLRELLDLATQRGVRTFLATARAAGVDLQQFASDDDAVRFRAQRSPYPPAASKSISRGGWITFIHPARFDPHRIQLGALLPLLHRVVVKLRGWDFPHIDPGTPHTIGLDHIEQVSEWQHHLEWWLFAQSGQLVDTLAFTPDWRDQSTIWPPITGWKPGEVLGVVDSVFKFTEIFEVAARLAADLPGDDDMQVSITGHGLRGRLLTLDDPDLTPFSVPRVATLAEMTYDVLYSRADLMSDPRNAAVKAAVWFFERFGWNAGSSTLQRMQETLRR